MRQMRLIYSIPKMCRVLRVSPSGFYKWLNLKPSKRVQEEGRPEAEIKAAHKRNREVCGPEGLQHNLKEHGIKVGVCRIRRIRKKLGIRCKQKRKFKATTDSKHTLPVAENLLNQQFKTTAPNRGWVSDITYVPTEEGWLYLAGHKDLFTSEVVGYSMGPRMTKNLIIQSLFKAVSAKRPGEGLIHHSDRGSQYCSHEYGKILDCFGMKASMSRKGNSRCNPLACFNPRPPRGGRPFVLWDIIIYYGFNPRPRAGGDTAIEKKLWHPKLVSIHAPARGATYDSSKDRDEANVSIHAPARGATLIKQRFQSVEGLFQSTPPRGGRLTDSQSGHSASHVSIHAPARGATILRQRAHLASYVSIHAPARGATPVMPV